MAPIHMEVETTLSPGAVRAALLDFSDRRPDLWPDLARSVYRVHAVGETRAEVTEGSKLPGTTIWAREAYDWSAADTIRWTVTESNFCAPGDYVEVTLHAREEGGTRVHIEWDRHGTNLAGRLAVGLIRLTKGKPVSSSFSKALQGLEQAKGS